MYSIICGMSCNHLHLVLPLGPTIKVLFYVLQDLLAFVNQSVKDCEDQQVSVMLSVYLWFLTIVKHLMINSILYHSSISRNIVQIKTNHMTLLISKLQALNMTILMLLPPLLQHNAFQLKKNNNWKNNSHRCHLRLPCPHLSLYL